MKEEQERRKAKKARSGFWVVLFVLFWFLVVLFWFLFVFFVLFCFVLVFGCFVLVFGLFCLLLWPRSVPSLPH